MNKSRNYYQLTVTRERSADIVIYGQITSMAEALKRWYNGDEYVSEVSARGIIQEIKDLDVDVINVYINSMGGEVAEALAIYSALRRHPAEVRTYVDGFACSAATIIFCAGTARTMGSIALLMIHNCMSYVGYGTSADLRKAAEDTEKINQSSIEAYKAVANIGEDQIRAMMDRETWLTAAECLKYGFATDIADASDEDDDTSAQQSAFPAIRNAVLANQEHERVPDKILTLLAEIDAKVSSLAPDDAIKGNYDGASVDKAKEFFNKLFSEV